MQTMKKYYIAMAVLALVSLGAVIWHFVISRSAAGDQQKVTDISSLQTALDTYFAEKNDLPDSLSDLSVDSDLAKRLSNYEYSHNTESFTLCATFATDVSLKNSSYSSLESDPYYHKKGRQCFTSEVPTYNFGDFYNDNTDNSESLNDYNGLYQ